MSPSPPSSPLQKMKNPFFCRSRFPMLIRPHGTARMGILVMVLVFLGFVLNELRCHEHGCVSRVGFYGGEKDTFIGGGSVLPPTKAEANEKTDYSNDENGGAMNDMAFKIAPWLSHYEGPFEEAEKDEEQSSESILQVGHYKPAPPAPVNANFKKGKWIGEKQSNTEVVVPSAISMKPTQAVSSSVSTDKSRTASPALNTKQPTTPGAGKSKPKFSPPSTSATHVDHAALASEVEEWVWSGRGDDPPMHMLKPHHEGPGPQPSATA
ncbi:hypothetical protein EJ04DRAFT_596868 [Polyplosphaeria fusca]|uniref:Uncharacterized protein n=1 Tax=Polyplosphaeria fusca TaxID=682080 RepID=A0A9P4QZK8_9PLEO|nr:hypothetical protein EJ04DRAFT_596868 [Polyplosphaeria fusca]